MRKAQAEYENCADEYQLRIKTLNKVKFGKKYNTWWWTVADRGQFYEICNFLLSHPLIRFLLTQISLKNSHDYSTTGSAPSGSFSMPLLWPLLCTVYIVNISNLHTKGSLLSIEILRLVYFRRSRFNCSLWADSWSVKIDCRYKLNIFGGSFNIISTKK